LKGVTDTATNSTLDRNAVLAARGALQPVLDRGWLDGFGNMLGKELGDWFGTRRWLAQTIIWLVIINGLMAFIMFIVPLIDPSEQVSPTEQVELGLGLYFGFSAILGAIGMIVLTQDEIIQEKQSGTAAWILSKPVSRSSFILTKLLSSFVEGLIFIAGLPGAVAYAEISFASQQALPILPYLMGVGVILLALIFYLTLVIMLGTLFEGRGPVMGVALGLLIGGLIASQFSPQISYILPVAMQNIAGAVGQSQPLPAIAISQLVTTVAWSVLFTAVALWRFARLEF
jgi:ABC-2 type transport system permease protein